MKKRKECYHRRTLPHKDFHSLVILLYFSQNSLGIGADLFFTILHTNDEHSALNPRQVLGEDGDIQKRGGIAALATAIEKIKKRVGEPLLLLSGGDFMGRSPYAWLILKGEATELKIMQEIGYDVITIGNHGFDYGPYYLAKYLQKQAMQRLQSFSPVFFPTRLSLMK